MPKKSFPDRNFIEALSKIFGFMGNILRTVRQSVRGCEEPSKEKAPGEWATSLLFLFAKDLLTY